MRIHISNSLYIPGVYPGGGGKGGGGPPKLGGGMLRLAGGNGGGGPPGGADVGMTPGGNAGTVDTAGPTTVTLWKQKYKEVMNMNL